MDTYNTPCLKQNYYSYEQSTIGMYGPVKANNDSHFGKQVDRKNLMYLSSNTQELILYYSNIRTYIWTYVPPVVLTIGIFCNLLSLIFWIRSLVKKRGSSSSYFFASLAIADIIALLFIPMYDHIGKAYYNGMDLRNYSNFTCKFYMFMFPFSLSFPSYILASLAVFRMIGILFPHKYKQICSARNAKIIIICILIFTFMVQIETIFRFKLTKLYRSRRSVCREGNDEAFFRVVLTFFRMIVTYFVPMLITVLSNLCIIWSTVSWDHKNKQGGPCFLRDYNSPYCRVTGVYNHNVTFVGIYSITSQYGLANCI